VINISDIVNAVKDNIQRCLKINTTITKMFRFLFTYLQFQNMHEERQMEEIKQAKSNV